MKKRTQIIAKYQRIEELKNYRNQLLASKEMSVSTGRSRGIFYIWTFALITVCLMAALIVLNVMMK